MVIGGDSCPDGHGFKSRRHLLDVHLDILHIDCKNCIVCLKNPKVNEKETGDGPLKQQDKVPRGCERYSLKSTLPNDARTQNRYFPIESGLFNA